MVERQHIHLGHAREYDCLLSTKHATKVIKQQRLSRGAKEKYNCRGISVQLALKEPVHKHASTILFVQETEFQWNDPNVSSDFIAEFFSSVITFGSRPR